MRIRHTLAASAAALIALFSFGIGTTVAHAWTPPVLHALCAPNSTEYSWTVTLSGNESNYNVVIRFVGQPFFNSQFPGKLGTTTFTTQRTTGVAELQVAWASDLSSQSGPVNPRTDICEGGPTPTPIPTPTPTAHPTPTPTPVPTPTQTPRPVPTPTPVVPTPTPFVCGPHPTNGTQCPTVPVVVPDVPTTGAGMPIEAGLVLLLGGGFGAWLARRKGDIV